MIGVNKAMQKHLQRFLSLLCALSENVGERGHRAPMNLPSSAD